MSADVEAPTLPETADAAGGGGDDGSAEWVRIQFCSDMHLELPMEVGRFGQHLRECLAKAEKDVDVDDDSLIGNTIPLLAPGNYLALLGDIFDGKKIRDGTYRDYLLKQCPGFQAVFILAGNHEFYRGEASATRTALAGVCAEVTEALGGTPTVHFLDCNHVDLPGTSLRVLGCTLWSEVADDKAEMIAKTLTDYSAIKIDGKTATVPDTNAWHNRERTWLEGALVEAEAEGKRCLVLSHHAPTFNKVCAPVHNGSEASVAFCTNLERLLRPPVTAWLFGHTHWSSWQCFRPAPDGEAAGGRWRYLCGGAEGFPQAAEFAAPAGLCRAAERGEVLVASNQTGYGAKGEHVKARCHPLMQLEVAGDGSLARLSCGPAAGGAQPPAQ